MQHQNLKHQNTDAWIVQLSPGEVYLRSSDLADILVFMKNLWSFLNIQNHGLLESRTGNFKTTVNNVKIDVLISEQIDEITSFLH